MVDKHVTLPQIKQLAERIKKELVSSGLSVPTKLSELTNDAGFQTADEVAASIAAADHIRRKIVNSIDDIDLTASDADKYFYLVKKTETDSEGQSTTYYDEYMVVGGKADMVGNTKIDLSGYVKYTDAATNEEVTSMLTEVFGEETSGG